MLAGAGLMARPKKRTKPTPPAIERDTIVNLKGSPEYADWLEQIHRRTHIPKSQIVRLAIAEWAANHGHPLPPEI